MRDVHLSRGAQLATDNIPLHYGDLLQEYRAALDNAILLDRSHEGRIEVAGPDRHGLLNRMSTNSPVDMQPGEGRPTVFINPNGRILDRVMAYNHHLDKLLIITQPGRGDEFSRYLRQNIFFHDKVTLVNISAATCQFALHGPKADTVIDALKVGLSGAPSLYSANLSISGVEVFVARNKPLVGTHWTIVSAADTAPHIYEAILDAGQSHGLIPAGSLTYNTLRIRAGVAAGRELSQEYIPLEVGLWDEISFNKGCYTGQEIIARMESRGQLARTLVVLKPDKFVEAPAPIVHEAQAVGTLTSSVQAPDGEIFALGVIKTRHLEIGGQVVINGVTARIERLAGVQPDYYTVS
jgi:aminomethyltransferase